MAAPARFPGGLTNVGPDDLMGMHGSTDASRYHNDFDDFNSFSTTPWTITKTGAGTTALGDLDNGVLVLTTTTASGDNVFMQKLGSSWKFETGKQLWFKARWKLSDATACAAIMGLQVTDTTPLAVSDGVFFIKAAGAKTVDFLVEASSVASTASAIASMADDTYSTMGFYYDGKSEITAWFDVAGNHPGQAITTALAVPVKVATLPVTNMPSAQLCISFGIQTSATAAKIMSVDYHLASKERI